MEKNTKRSRTPKKIIENTNVVIKEETTIEVKEETTEIQIVKTMTLKQIYEQYAIDNNPYKIYLRGQLIFNSINHKDKPIFFDDYFILFGNKYIYKGIRFEKY